MKKQKNQKVEATPINVGGRCTKCTDTRIEIIASAMAEGLPFERSCVQAGITASTGYNWLRWGEAGQEPYSRFFEDIKKAEVDGELALVRNIQNAARDAKHWTAAAWLLERRYPQRWSKNRDLSDESGATLERAETVSESIQKALDGAIEVESRRSA